MEEREEELISPEERQRALEELREWLQNHDAPDAPMINFMTPEEPIIGKVIYEDFTSKMFTPREFVEALDAQYAVAEALLERVVEEARALGVSASRFMEHLGEAPPGESMGPSTNGTH